MLDRQPTLADARLLVRPLATADWPALFAAAADPLIWAGHPAHDRWCEPVFRAWFDEAMASGGALVVVEVATGALVGSSRYDLTRGEAGEVEIGWTFLVREHWGGTTNLALKRLMVGHALESVERVIFLVGDTNGRSRRALDKIGAVPNRRIHHVEISGRPVRHLVYALDREAFARGPLAGSG